MENLLIIHKNLDAQNNVFSSLFFFTSLEIGKEYVRMRGNYRVWVDVSRAFSLVVNFS